MQQRGPGRQKMEEAGCSSNKLVGFAHHSILGWDAVIPLPPLPQSQTLFLIGFCLEAPLETTSAGGGIPGSLRSRG